MTNYQFWKVLEGTMKQPQNDISILIFSKALAEVCKDSDKPEIWCSFTEDDGLGVGTCSQTHIDSPDGKFMLCFTRKTFAEKDNRRLRKEGAGKIHTKLVPLKEVMDNMFAQNNIAGLIFNAIDEKHMYLVTKNFLRVIMEDGNDQVSN